MSFLARNSLRVVARAAPRRGLTTKSTAESAYWAESETLKHHAIETTDLWRKISYYGCLPGIAVCVAWVYNAEVEHAAHLQHLRDENGGELPEVPAFDYMNRRNKPYPWGVNSLFFNPHVNKNLEEA